MTPEQKAAAVAVLEAAVDMTIATNRSDGWPQGTMVSFVHDGLTIYFGTGGGSQKARNLDRDDRAAVTVTPPYADWNGITGLSLAARARRVVEPDEVQKVGALMFERFPQISQYAGTFGGDELALFALEPSFIVRLDYTKGFGWTESFVVD